MSIRNEEIGDLVLDAARVCLLRSGGRKVTVSEVARQAGVSRPTVYRRWPDITEIIRDLLTREVLTIVDHVIGERGEPQDLDALADQVVTVVGALRDSDLISSLWREQRDFMAPYVFERLGTSQQGVLALLADMLAQGQGRKQVRAGDAKRMASMVLLIAQSFLQSGALVSDILAEGWSTELHGVIAGYLRPAP
ncbi:MULTISPECIES: TetR/AcrR family transcriptional regulator [Gordonia]|jgi:AcrR family transcriptional regulator|uniref:TetR family transcriptional regulator n=2 Tax=Gordonia alkanivorans TaxID=84096 RepID=W9DLE2_9ACTN|nr:MULTISPECIES: TetR/AcrR family transcriptional regulator [Gordonia]AZZ80478.1 TetR/AcrR family transcriptional regulator [Gordonia alkanivorans]ETA08231.1 TetR family transcriptional regulator [Gordonia alkanivorans CGMCC 6845]MDH3006170.1 TetR/AcrR family transcriptional regulator [Gordonia alkanivorans]MDH3012805.1 TetR/AcrR family transcriptional regulator [Gordonia alkanivorans]MDH3015925.1 TetR/AcrR family transcriptional regulator [Gordonia alkanivorans]